jgi:transposase
MATKRHSISSWTTSLFTEKQKLRDMPKLSKIKFYWMPTNASWLNRIECQFTALKKFALENTDCRTHEALQGSIESYLSWRNRNRQIGVKDWETYCWHTKKVI